MTEWLTTGQMIDRLKVGEVAEAFYPKKNGEMERLFKITRKANDLKNLTNDTGIVIFDNTFMSCKWRILNQDFVTFETALDALKAGKVVTYHDDHDEGYTFDLKIDWGLEEAAIYSLADLLKPRWTIEE